MARLSIKKVFIQENTTAEAMKPNNQIPTLTFLRQSHSEPFVRNESAFA